MMNLEEYIVRDGAKMEQVESQLVVLWIQFLELTK
jgi:hypothetical protein